MPHAPPAQPAEALAGAGQTTPQPPQLFASVDVFFSQPSAPIALQFA
jgi:hypothetical protein